MNSDQEMSNKTYSHEILIQTKLLCKLFDIVGNKSQLEEEFRHINDTQAFCNSLDDLELPHFGLTTDQMIKNGIIYAAYALIVIISLVGNLMVVWAIFSKKRMRTTVNIFIGNLATSDLMMTIFNIPFSSARLLMDNWIFGDFMCHTAPFLQVVAVYVSTITMAYIAIDRYQAIMSPMGWRISTTIGTKWGIFLIWLMSIIFSIPYVVFSRTVELRGLDKDWIFYRCRMVWPEPKGTYKQTINVTTFILQFAIPFVILSVLYVIIGLKIWSRETIGATTIEQQNRQMIAKRRTIFMLLLVAIVFAVCWLPLNVYYLLEDFAQYHNTNLKIGFHWLAMSSVCYNPFIYFCLNRRFKQVLKSLSCCLCCDSVSSPISLPPSNNHQNFLVNMSKIIFGSRQPDASNDLSSGNPCGTNPSGINPCGKNPCGKNRGTNPFNDENSNSGRGVLDNLRNNVDSVVIRSSGSNNSTILTMNNNATPLNTMNSKGDEHNLCVQKSVGGNHYHQSSSCSSENIHSSCRKIPPVNMTTGESDVPLSPDDETTTGARTFEHFCLTRISDPDKYDIILCESSLRSYSRRCNANTSSSKNKDYDMTVRAARFVDTSSF